MPPFLARMIVHSQVPHALLFTGREVDEIAYQFAEELICSAITDKASCKRKMASRIHPDLHLYRPEGKSSMHPIDTLRQLSYMVAMSPFEGKWKVFIIHDADKMLPTSANALLKTFEEPTSGTVIILLSQHPEHLLPTVLSRCQRFNFPTPQPKTNDLTPLQTELLDILGQRRPQEHIEVLASQLEEEKKEWEKQMRLDLPQELTPFQRERYTKEIEGAVTMRYQEKAYALLETIILWYRDRTLLEIEGGESYLHFPDRIAELKQTPLIAIDRVEKYVSQSRLALSRSIKFITCLSTLLLQFNCKL